MRLTGRWQRWKASLLVVDAAQGVEAQTLANVYQAIENDHEIVSVLDKIDLPAAEPDRVRQQIEGVYRAAMHQVRWRFPPRPGVGIEESPRSECTTSCRRRKATPTNR